MPLAAPDPLHPVYPPSPWNAALHTRLALAQRQPPFLLGITLSPATHPAVSSHSHFDKTGFPNNNIPILKLYF